MKETVYVTLKVFTNAASTLIYLSDYLGIEMGDVVRLTFYRMGDPEKETFVLNKRVVRVGNAKGCYIDKCCGICRGDVIIARIDPIVGDESDPRVKTEKGFEDPFD